MARTAIGQMQFSTGTLQDDSHALLSSELTTLLCSISHREPQQSNQFDLLLWYHCFALTQAVTTGVAGMVCILGRESRGAFAFGI